MHEALQYKKFIRIISVATIFFGVILTIFNLLISRGMLEVAVVGHMPLATDAALCFLFSGLSLYLAVSEKRKKRLISKILAVVVFIAGLHAFLDEFSFLSLRSILEMSAQTGICFILLSIALFVIRTTDIAKITQWLLHAVTLISFVAFIGHLLSVPGLYHFSALTAMAVYTAFAFILLSVTATLVNPSYGITGIFTGGLIGNLMARRLFFAMVGGIVGLAYLRLVAHKNDLVSVEMGTALMAIAFCAITLILILIVSSILNKSYMKVRTAQENLKHVVDAAPYAIIMADYDGNIIQVNRKTEQLYGYQDNELIGTPLRDLIPFSLHGDYAGQRREFFETNEVLSYREDSDLMATRKNGTEFPVEMHFVPLQTDNGKYFLTYMIDVSLSRQNQQIITTQLAELQSKNQELEQFNYISSHDLQEPLRTVLNYMDMIEEDYPDINPDVQMHLVSVKNTVTRMSRIVKSLLDFGRLGRNKKMALTNVRQLITDVMDDLQNMIRESEANITIFGVMPDIYTYETELRQIFQNLISNAIKFRHAGVRPEIEITCKKMKGFYRFSVSDNGIGIDPKYFDRIFNIFQRLNREEDYEGHGIGLANCKKIAEMHGGKIWVESEPGKGTTFIFTILNFTSG